MNVTLDTWIISDTHFNHDNIVKYCGRPENHTQLIEDNWFAAIAADDTVLHLGDLFMGPRRDSLTILERLPGRKHFIKGNHDKQPDRLYADLGWKRVEDFVYFRDGNYRILFSHYPDTEHLADWTVNIHGHIHNNGYPEGTDFNRDYRNVSIEVMDYKPVKLRDILYAGKFQNPRQAGVWKQND